ncbi:anti-sigma factor [Yoonia sediminilitoris]|uniref:Anti-sigma-K factor RskA n=1 Tax=Yoonia sediminilitoris TaxID=1286148 RepID=A0A2T6KAA1_9RHOB|nr:anti-sigma factor [Yoonia sediminilitoris]PUB11770.1 anti-sigma-K factor RskA [Yoonia sediminilitoris]RCW91847.1 anti-sigma-K factor RskA [Yoonia sediminilitoris]
MSDDTIRDDDDMLAAEYALRLLEGVELQEAQSRLANDPDFARSVMMWDGRLAALTDDIAPEQPSPRAKSALMARLFPEPARAPFWQGARIWQMLSVLSLLLLAVVGFIGLNGPKEARGPLYTAEITAPEGDFRVVAVVDKSTNEVILTKTRGAASAGRILQVWAHGEGAPAISVGLWPEGDSVRLSMPPTIAAVEGILTLGVSEEPVGGSPTGSPSGRVFGTVDIPGVSSTL